jgi:hypothetical protein
MPAMRACLPGTAWISWRLEMHVRSFRVALSAGSIAVLWTLFSVISALAGDVSGPLPK